MKCLLNDSLPVMTEFLENPCERVYRSLKIGQWCHSWKTFFQVFYMNLVSQCWGWEIALAQGLASKQVNSANLNVPICETLRWKIVHMYVLKLFLCL